MTEELTPETVDCPSCLEEVHKTLYCLNCGFPLYRDDIKIPLYKRVKTRIFKRLPFLSRLTCVPRNAFERITFCFGPYPQSFYKPMLEVKGYRQEFDELREDPANFVETEEEAERILLANVFVLESTQYIDPKIIRFYVRRREPS